MRDVQIYLTRVCSDIPADADRGAFPLVLPFVEGLDIQFKTPVTFIVGENGSGKSTLLEALADLADLPVRGGGRNELADHGGESELAPFLRSSWVQRSGHGLFFRAEFEERFASLLDDQRRDDPGFVDDPYRCHGGRSLHQRSPERRFSPLTADVCMRCRWRERRTIRSRVASSRRRRDIGSV